MKIISRYFPVLVVIAFVSLALFYIPIKADSGVSKEIYLVGSIDQRSALDIRYLLIKADQEPGDITLYIDSDGGGVIDGFVIIDTIRQLKNDVSTVALGNAHSMAAIILSTGTKGKRFANPHSIIMIHQMSLSVDKAASQKIDEWYKMIEIMNKIEKQLCEELGRTTGKDPLVIRKDLKEDHWFTSQEALEYGLIDYIIGGK